MRLPEQERGHDEGENGNKKLSHLPCLPSQGGRVIIRPVLISNIMMQAG
jgi:hypothetical protein